jgi:hypothetical protein
MEANSIAILQQLRLLPLRHGINARLALPGAVAPHLCRAGQRLVRVTSTQPCAAAACRLCCTPPRLRPCRQRLQYDWKLLTA